jgi:hypothetical protein
MAPADEAAHAKAWEQWYRLARYALACEHEEAVQYANLRFVEEQNRASLRSHAAEQAAARKPS